MNRPSVEYKGLLEAFWLLSTLHAAVRTAESVRARRQPRPIRHRLRQEVRQLRQLLDRLQLALLYADVVGDQTFDAALLHRFDLLLTAREVADGWRTLHQGLLSWYPAVPAVLVEAARRAARQFDRLGAQTPVARWQATLRFGNRVLRAIWRILHRQR
ncbi:MAG: hypothetical protein Q9M35_09190 [Rhodothermus sp.]|nr:hypothetical protein [Rhodothermus sp.]